MKLEEVSYLPSTFSKIVPSLILIQLTQKIEEIKRGEIIYPEELSKRCYYDYRGKRFCLEDFLEEYETIEGIRCMIEVCVGSLENSFSIISPFEDKDESLTTSHEYRVKIYKIK